MRILLSGLAALVGLASCGELPDPAPWREQVAPGGACHDMDLSDGFDETGSADLVGLVGCVDQTGWMAPLNGVLVALDEPTAAGVPAGGELGVVLNALPSEGVDPLALAGLGIALLQDEDAPLDAFLTIGVEMAYALPYVTIDDRSFDGRRVSALPDGVLLPLGKTLPGLGAALLTDDASASSDAASAVGEALASDTTARWIHTLAELARSERATPEAVRERLLADLGQALVDSTGPSTSLRDLTERLTGDEAALDALAPSATEILGDRRVRNALQAELAEVSSNRLAAALRGLRRLARITPDGLPTSDPADSALAALLRLTAATHDRLRCQADLGVTELDVDIPSLAVDMLQQLADTDPGLVRGGAVLFGQVVGWGFTEELLSVVAQSGVCPLITRQVADDLRAVDRLADDDQRDLLGVLLRVLAVLAGDAEAGDPSRLVATADLLEAAHDAELAAPLGALLSDVGDGPLADSLADLVAVLAEPASYGVSLDPERHPDGPADLEDALELTAWLTEPDPERGGLRWHRFRPVLDAMVRHEATWVSMAHLGRLLDTPGARSRELLNVLPELVEADPDLTVLTQLAPLVDHPVIAAPFARVVAAGHVTGAAFARRPPEGASVPPATWLADRVRTGTLADLLSLVDTALRSFATLAPAEPEEP